MKDCRLGCIVRYGHHAQWCEISERLEALRVEIRAERISYGEISELQSLAEYIDPSDMELREWAGIPEFEE